MGEYVAMEDQVAIVTGACSGIGLALTRHLLVKNWKVVMADINVKRGAQLATELGPNSHFVSCDVSSWDSQAALFKEAKTWGGHVSFLAANAGIFDSESLLAPLKAKTGSEPVKPDTSTIDVNLVGVMYGIQLFLHYAKQAGRRGGKVVITASLAGTYPFPIFPAYCASKAALVSYARNIAPRLKRSAGISVNVISPSFIDTAMAADLKDILPDEFWTPMSTIMEAYDQFLDENTGKTGVVLETTGANLAARGLPPTISEEQGKLAVSWREITGQLIEPWDGDVLL